MQKGQDFEKTKGTRDFKTVIITHYRKISTKEFQSHKTKEDKK
jgi:hypothetical protein